MVRALQAHNAAEGTESALQKLQESLHNAGERIQEGITPTSQEDALLSQGVIPSNTQVSHHSRLHLCTVRPF